MQAREEIDFVSAERETDSVVATSMQRLQRIQVPQPTIPYHHTIPFHTLQLCIHTLVVMRWQSYYVYRYRYPTLP